VAPLAGRPADDGPVREPYYSHHFIGGNAYVPALIGADVDAMGQVEPYPELSVYSYSSADPESRYYNAYWVGTEEATGRPTHHARLAWDRLRHALELELEAPERVAPGQDAALQIAVRNTGCGHNFPSGFPEGRVAWVSVRARDLGTGEELEIHDAHWGRTSRGVGGLTPEDGLDPNYPDRCGWKAPAGSPDPFAYQMKAVASKGDGCPTLDLVLATALNLETDEAGRPVDADGEVIDGSNPDGLPVFRDLDGDGDRFDDAFLMDTRLRPLPHEEATVDLDRYSVMVPPGTVGPVAVTAAVYYQSLEAVVAKKFLGNLADTDMDHVLEPCVLGGACDGRTPRGEPPVVEGAPPVPMEVVTRVVALEGRRDDAPPVVLGRSPAPDGETAGRSSVVRVQLSEPVRGLDAGSFRLVDGAGRQVPASVDQVGEMTWALFPDAVDLTPGERYTARLEPVCDPSGNCLAAPEEWSFRVTGGE
ncbi:MAG: Ig-like domain-containing protein, partial [Acidobacteriota bacterium]